MNLKTLIKIMKQSLVGREKEQQNLNIAYNSKKASFIAIYGRRRIGKSFLIQKFIESKIEQDDCNVFLFSGSDLKTNQTQCEDFLDTMQLVFETPYKKPLQKNWNNLFSLLTNKIQYSQSCHPDKKIVLVFDELQWLDKKNSNFLASLAFSWNTAWYLNPNIKLIISGSSASFIKKKILKNKSDFYGRLTLRMELKQFSLQETKQYFIENGFDYTNQEIAECYMCIGGIAYYLDRFETSQTVHENIRDIFFGEQAYLPEEMDDLFTTFSKSSYRYLEIVKSIYKKTYGIRANQLQKKYKNTHSYLTELIASGFIQKVQHLEDGRYRSYRVVDPFINFYLNWVQPAQSTRLKTKITWDQRAAIDQNFRKWLGYQFELLCWNHRDQIRDSLNIEIGVYDHFHWSYSTKISQGTEIDLFYIREDGIIQIFEIKYTSNRDYKIDKEYSKRLGNKIKVFNQQAIPKIQTFLKRQKNKKIQYQRTILTFITFTNLAQNKYSQFINSNLTLDQLMDS